ncbi:hypothetical protein PNA2_1093 [Pyrococcus sp. NA2]|uniref:transglutaminase domain-containing protein n=1 Tax=Pyrococcus sp. (strain NA2) TaxID=342949 RepID=UPI000209AAE7|nr:transglutaminase domain-containing protein [Pyrococcus sp. NA2]AEC52009.1 hypothetical protein PNA2_1093 [Pyrococcus sp. NA2]
MKHLKILVVMLATLMLGCLIKSPASVRFEIDRTTIPPNGTFHIIVLINNTGKVGIVDAKLMIEGDEFLILQSPKLGSPLKVGDSAKLIWTVKGPSVPGTYQLKIYLDIVDELNRVWKGIRYETRIRVSSGEAREGVTLKLEAPSEVQGGEVLNVSAVIFNNLTIPIKITNAEITAENFDVLEKHVPDEVGAKSKGVIRFKLRAKPTYRKVRIYVLVDYVSLQTSGKLVGGKSILIVWRPWELSEKELKDVYGNFSEWIFYDKVVDGYWEWMYGSFSEIGNRSVFRKDINAIINSTNSDVEAARAVYNYIVTNYVIEKRRIKTLNPREIKKLSSISPEEAEILMVAYLRSLNIPARIVSVYKEPDCTYYPFVEAYLSDRWYVIDFNHMFFGTREDFIASRWYPRIYQEISTFNNELVALEPSSVGHKHKDLTKEYIKITKQALFLSLSHRLDAATFSRLNMLLTRITDENEKIFAMFLFSSGDPSEVKWILTRVNVDNLKRTIDAFYEFYKDMQWEDDFRVYWEKLINLYR